MEAVQLILLCQALNGGILPVAAALLLLVMRGNGGGGGGGGDGDSSEQQRRRWLDGGQAAAGVATAGGQSGPGFQPFLDTDFQPNGCCSNVAGLAVVAVCVVLATAQLHSIVGGGGTA